MRWVKVAKADDLGEREGKLVHVDNEPVALFKVEGNFFAISHVCPHQGGPIADSEFIDKFVVQCPWHGWTFDIRDGKPDHEGGTSIEAYEVKVEDGFIYIGGLKK